MNKKLYLGIIVTIFFDRLLVSKFRNTFSWLKKCAEKSSKKSSFLTRNDQYVGQRLPGTKNI